mmetsp:Transcript_1797/g.2557  ORF Transcript_1797/g.2557 Transcript_1797/m.2557 type:complete len:253 (-) Transcript_1797:50-808(-)|eukprot:CAMPEP_0201548692 /NCGR_PEP_ID=MMETSP0173_2-20130828/5220_1 /ASSEMBLY_ACC=CAM_ASM_000268 /TAXON_ID=218659 /ORGANISM="Vexillifera sp., Strain DIVA3 564/2" /LENGTH=252 /DNA_ID=CAMNT_0047958143 /DNA_START=29 /DNA_END=787 /DNA_ORIENTATION=+
MSSSPPIFIGGAIFLSKKSIPVCFSLDVKPTQEAQQAADRGAKKLFKSGIQIPKEKSNHLDFRILCSPKRALHGLTNLWKKNMIWPKLKKKVERVVVEYSSLTPRLEAKCTKQLEVLKKALAYQLSTQSTITHATQKLTSVPKLSPKLETCFQKLTDLQDGWDGFHSYAPNSELIELAQQVILNLDNIKLEDPDIYPDESGEIIMVWPSREISLHLALDDAVFYRIGVDENLFTHENTHQSVLEELQKCLNS